MNHNKRLAVSIVTIFSILVMACQCPLTSLLEPTPTPTPRPEPLPPQVIQVMPERGEEQLLTAPIQLVFDQPMDAETVEDAFSIEPDVSGDFEWVTDRMVQFKPSGEGFERATKYTVTLDDDAESAEGLEMKAEVEFRFTTVGFLEVTAVQPAEDTTAVATDATVIVLFNRPVVPLVAIEDQGNLPQPLTFVPPVAGTGEWLNTSIYLFTPDEAPGEGFEPATTYKARVAGGLADTTGGVLAEDFTWEFTTVMPAVVGSHPGAGTIYVSPEPTIHVAFNQPMDHAATEAAFELRPYGTDDVIPGSFEWHDEGLALSRRDTYEPYQWSWDPGAGPERVGVETLSFTPDQALDFITTYQMIVSTDAKGASGAALSHEYDAAFATITYPRIVSTYPVDGAERVRPGEVLRVSFSSPMRPESINDNFTISPPVSATQVYTYWWDSDTELEISFPTDPNTDFAVTISGDVEGRYGHKLGEDTTIRWRTRALDPMVYLHSPGRVGTYNAYTETLAYVTVRNLGRIEFALYRMPLKDFLKANGDDWWDFWDDYRGESENLIRAWSLDVDPPLNQRRFYGTRLNTEGLLEPGLYYLEVSADTASIYPEARHYTPEAHRRMLVVSRHNLSLKTTPGGARGSEALVWATDLQSGDVLPDLPITLMTEHTGILAEGTTDQDGVFDSGEHRPLGRWTSVFAFAGDPENPDENFSAAITDWDDGISPWRFDLPVDYYPSRYAGYMFTDRPIYRPGQTVYFKGILRGDDDARYTLLTGDAKVHVLISDPEGKDVSTHDLTLSDMGTLDESFDLDEEAATGTYYIEANYLVDKETRFHTTFQVAEYRKPEFQVEVETDRPEYTQGDEINVTAQATYFFGGPVADAEVSYVVLSADHFFNYQGQGWWDFGDYDYWWYGDGASYYGERIADGEGTTDAEGRFTFSLEADIAEEITSQRYTLEVTVTDVNYQEVSNRTEAIVHKGSYYIGLRPERYVGTVGQKTSVNVITVDWESEPSPNRELTVIFAEHNWYNVQKQAEDGRFYWEWAVEDVPVYTTTVETGSDGEGTVSFTPEKGGSYKVIATGLDEKGYEVRSSTYVWVSGREYVSWRRENNDRIELVADKREYQVGDTATILVPHPFQGPVQALVTIERGHIYEYWVQTLETNSEQIEIPITEDLIPNIFVSIVIAKGTDETSPLPGFKIGYVQLPIETTEKELTIAMTPDKPPEEHYQPGDKVTYDVQITNSGGDPVEAEVTLALIDLAVLTLADRPGQGLVNYFWRERGLGISTAVGLTLSGDRVNEEIAEEVKGLGGGGGAEEFGPVRKRFPDLAYWNAMLQTGADGQATISVELPDNLTTWRMSAWAATGETLVGQADVDIISTKDLLVRSVAPRFFVVGDEAELAAVVHNNTAHTLEVDVSFEAEGLQISSPLAGQGSRVSVTAGDKAKIVWPVTVEDREEVTLRFGARTTGLSDAVEITLPVYRYSTPEVVATAGQLKKDGQVLEAAVLPPSYDPTQGELSVHIDPSLAAGMVDGLDYLEHYPYECTEQTVSRFLPNVVTYRAFQELGLDRPDLEASLPGLVSQGLQRLYNQQHYDGGWGWWVQDESRPYLTAYVLLGLVEADRAGFTVDEEVMEQAADFLEDSFVKPRDLETNWKANQQAFILYVLAEAGEGDLARTETLFQQREALDTFGRAYLAMAFGLLEPDEADRVDTLLSDITSDAILSATGAHWEEEHVDYYAMNTDTRSTAIVLAALARLDPDSGLAPNVVRWLMVVRKDGYWETTQETAWAIIGLTDWMAVTGELEGNYDWHVIANGELLGEGSVNSENVDQTTKLQIEVAQLLAEEANRVVIERWAPEGEDEGTGRLYYSLYLRYFKPVEEVTALNRGIIVSRRYTRVDCDPEEGRCPAIDGAQVGDAIRVKLTIIAPNDLHYVVIEDPFPAGAEGVDRSLKTTSIADESPELVRTDRYDPWGGWGWWWFSHTDLRDEKAVLFASYLPRGTYEYTYLIRASLPGEFRAIPTHAYEMYFPEVFGRSDGGVFTITE